MWYIPKVKSTSGLSDGLQKEQRLFSGENRPNDIVRSSSRKMQVALIHSTGERKRLPKDGRQDKQTQLSSVSCTAAERTRGKACLSIFFSPQRLGLLPSVKTDRRQKWFKAADSMSTAGTLSNRWRSPPGFKISQGGRGLTGYKGDRKYHLCHLLVDGDGGDPAANQRC